MIQRVMEFAEKPRQVRLARRRDGWWVVDLPDRENQEIGPYATRMEADDARDGMVRFFTRNPNYADWPVCGKRGAK